MGYAHQEREGEREGEMKIHVKAIKLGSSCLMQVTKTTSFASNSKGEARVCSLAIVYRVGLVTFSVAEKFHTRYI